eukprot:TRINITY_DN6547_c0_g3_i2.p1 TRINITY_DN6547_c0_g3~~TRINITY_DN6547_c0_g3_i2.p1  ORF type:complete len:324 (+),score=52.73 TRINITY_DN6547_c0_g3_i2:143-973(+)
MNLPVHLSSNLPPLSNLFLNTNEAPFTNLDPLLPELELPVLDSPFQTSVLVEVSSSVPTPCLTFESSRADSEWSDILTDLDSDVSPDMFQTNSNPSIQKQFDSDVDVNIEVKPEIDTEVPEEDEEGASSNVCRHVGCSFRSKNKKLKLQHRTAREHEKNKRLHLSHFNSRGKDCPLCIYFLKDGTWKKEGDDLQIPETSTPDRKRKRTSTGNSVSAKKKTRLPKRAKKDLKSESIKSEKTTNDCTSSELGKLKEGLFRDMDKIINSVKLLRSSELK